MKKSNFEITTISNYGVSPQLRGKLPETNALPIQSPWTSTVCVRTAVVMREYKEVTSCLSKSSLTMMRVKLHYRRRSTLRRSLGECCGRPQRFFGTLPRKAALAQCGSHLEEVLYSGLGSVYYCLIRVFCCGIWKVFGMFYGIVGGF